MSTRGHTCTECGEEQASHRCPIEEHYHLEQPCCAECECGSWQRIHVAMRTHTFSDSQLLSHNTTMFRFGLMWGGVGGFLAGCAFAIAFAHAHFPV